jgi:hypothetical protein
MSAIAAQYAAASTSAAPIARASTDPAQEVTLLSMDTADDVATMADFDNNARSPISTPPHLIIDLPVTPPRSLLNSRSALPPGTPLSVQRQKSLHAQEQRGRSLIIQALEETSDEPLPPLMDDDWEDYVPNDDPNDDILEHDVPYVQDAHQQNDPHNPPSGPATAHTITPSDLPVAPVALGIPPHKLAENEPDPFLHLADPATSNLPTDAADVHPESGVYMLYMLVTWLHLQFHVPFRACTAIIGVFSLIIQAFGRTVHPPPITTLPRIMSKLEVEPDFDILPICPNCLEVFPNSMETPATCPCCNTFIYKPIPTNSKPRQPNDRIPLLRFPYKSIESQLTSLLAVPGLEAKLDNWRKLPRTSGKYQDVFDGNIPKNLKMPDGQRFFKNDADDVAAGPNGELRIGLSLGVDW